MGISKKLLVDCFFFLSLCILMTSFGFPFLSSKQVVVFSKSYCPFCTKTKDLFTEMGVDFVVHEMDEMGDDGPDLQAALMKMTGQKSVPNVFVKQQHIGGNDDTQSAAKAGKLKELLGI